MISLPFTLVLDDFQSISSNEIFQGLKRLISYMPANMRLIIASREEIPFSLARLRLQNAVLEISKETLAFDFDETQRYLRDVADIDIDTDALFHVFDGTQGWIAGVKIIALALKHGASRDVTSSLVTSTSSKDFLDLFEFFGEEMIDALDESSRNFLLKTSFLSELNTSLCDYVLGIDNSDCILQTLENQGIFVSALGEAGGWYRLHPLLRQYLNRVQRSSYHEKVQQKFNRSAAEWLEQNGYLERSLGYYVECGEYQHVLGVIDRLYGSRGTRSDLTAPVYALLSNIPNALICDYPRCALIYIVSLFHMGLSDELFAFMQEENGKVLNQALEQMSPESKDYHLCCAFIAYARKEYQRAALAATCAISIDANGTYSLDGLLMLLASRCYFALGDSDKAIKMLQGSIDNAYEHQMVEECLMSTRELARVYASLGCIYEAESVLQGALRYAERFAFDGVVVDYLRFALALANREWGNAEQLDSLLKGRQAFVAAQMQHFEGWLHSPDFFLELSRCYCALGDYERSRESFHSAKDLLKRHLDIPLLPEQITYARLKFWLLSDNQDRIDAWVNARRTRPFTGTELAGRLRTVMDALVLMSRDEPQQALDLLALKLADDADIMLMAFRIDYHLVKAWANLRLYGIEYAKPHVMLAAKRGLQGGYIQHFIDWGPWLEPLLTALAQDLRSETCERNTELIDYIERIARALSQAFEQDAGPSWQRRLCAGTPVQLTGREREILRLLVEQEAPKQIAAALGISVATVQAHISRVYRKLDVHNRYEAVEKAKKMLK